MVKRKHFFSPYAPLRACYWVLSPTPTQKVCLGDTTSQSWLKKLNFDTQVMLRLTPAIQCMLSKSNITPSCLYVEDTYWPQMLNVWHQEHKKHFNFPHFNESTYFSGNCAVIRKLWWICSLYSEVHKKSSLNIRHWNILPSPLFH